MPPPTRPPLGLALARTAKAVGRAFDEAMAAAGGSLPTWLVLLSLKAHQQGTQRELAEAAGIRGATLTHHLNAMEAAGLLTRRPDPANRRAHIVELTEAGEALFCRLRGAAAAFDRRLCAGLTADELGELERLLERLRRNVAGSSEGGSVADSSSGPA